MALANIYKTWDLFHFQHLIQTTVVCNKILIVRVVIAQSVESPEKWKPTDASSIPGTGILGR